MTHINVLADGDTFDPARDGARLAHQHEAILGLCRDGHWRSLGAIQAHFQAQGVHFPEASISARLRDFRKPKHGSWTVERRYVRRGLFEYRLVANVDVDLFGPRNRGGVAA